MCVCAHVCVHTLRHDTSPLGVLEEGSLEGIGWVLSGHSLKHNLMSLISFCVIFLELLLVQESKLFALRISHPASSTEESRKTLSFSQGSRTFKVIVFSVN